jgi:hypothetical protein
MNPKSCTKKMTSLTREDDEERERRLRIGRVLEIVDASLEKGRGKGVIRVVPRSEGDAVTNVSGCISRGEKKLGESRARDFVGVQSKLIKVICNGAESNFDENLLVSSRELRGLVLLAKTRDRKEATVKGDRGKERLHVEDRFRG